MGALGNYRMSSFILSSCTYDAFAIVAASAQQPPDVPSPTPLTGWVLPLATRATSCVQLPWQPPTSSTTVAPPPRQLWLMTFGSTAPWQLRGWRGWWCHSQHRCSGGGRRGGRRRLMSPHAWLGPACLAGTCMPGWDLHAWLGPACLFHPPQDPPTTCLFHIQAPHPTHGPPHPPTYTWAGTRH
jgi:hypothetical protein